jgi:N-acetylneuraminic acid mutarotase
MLFPRTNIFFALLGLFGVSTTQSNACEPNTWLNLAPIPIALQEHSTVAINDTTIAVIGGVIPGANGTMDTTDLMLFYDIPSNTWRNKTPSPYKVNHPNVAVVCGKLYLLGGLVDGPVIPGSPINWVASAESYVYDPTLDAWKELEPMPSGTERGSANIGVHGEMIYLAGGMTLLSSYQVCLLIC